MTDKRFDEDISGLGLINTSSGGVLHSAIVKFVLSEDCLSGADDVEEREETSLVLIAARGLR